MPRPPYLTKSSYVRGITCQRLLWLSWHQRLPYDEPPPGSPAAVGTEIVERRLDELAPAAGGSLVQRHQDADGGVEAGDEIDNRNPDAQRLTAFLAVDAHQPAPALKNFAKP